MPLTSPNRHAGHLHNFVHTQWQTCTTRAQRRKINARWRQHHPQLTTTTATDSDHPTEGQLFDALLDAVHAGDTTAGWAILVRIEPGLRRKLETTTVWAAVDQGRLELDEVISHAWNAIADVARCRPRYPITAIHWATTRSLNATILGHRPRHNPTSVASSAVGTPTDLDTVDVDQHRAASTEATAIANVLCDDILAQLAHLNPSHAAAVMAHAAGHTQPPDGTTSPNTWRSHRNRGLNSLTPTREALHA